MRLLGCLFAISACVAAAVSEKCYGPLGCFRIDGPFYDFAKRPASSYPQSREDVNTQFFLYTRQVNKQVLKAENRTSLAQSAFNITKPTKFVIHGFWPMGDDPKWVQLMIQELIKHGDYNVIVVYWRDGAGLPYKQAASNTRLVAAETALLIQKLQNLYGKSIRQVHIIGHSLGAHTAGYIGQRVPIDRISGLDPAEPYFQGLDKVVRLDSTDAKFVDVIHTDAESLYLGGFRGGFGMDQAAGDLDFYPNGGYNQPGCNKNIFTTISINGISGKAANYFLTCDHNRATFLFADSINNACPYSSYPCEDAEKFKAGECSSCGVGGCPQMGFHAEKYRNVNNSVHYFLQTGAKANFCGYHYTVTIHVSKSMYKSVQGSLHIQLNGKMATSDKINLSPAQWIEPGKVYRFMILSEKEVGSLDNIIIGWKHSPSWFRIWSWGIFVSPTIKLDRVVVTETRSQKNYTLCMKQKGGEIGDSLIAYLVHSSSGTCPKLSK